MENENVKNRAEHYDVGVFGVWSGCNYGSIATYYALNRILTSMGKTVLMIDKPILMEDDVEIKENHSRRFGREHYNISRRYRLNEMYRLNQVCDTFLIGSDQVWNYGISKNFGKAFYLDFAGADKKKIAYAISFGHEIDFAPPDEREVIADYMRYFDGIGTREEDGVKICRDCYGIKAEQVLDPVFLADPQIYDELAEKSSHREEEPFIVSYILDPSPEKTEAILHLRKQFGGIKAVNLLDGLPWLFEKNKKLTNLPDCIENLQVEDWLYYLKNARFVLTDSCHGASFALIFKRNFIAITNKGRGISRFNSLSRLFRFENHMTSDPKDVITNPRLLDPIDYGLIADIMEAQRRRCYQWLYDAVNLPKKSEKELTEKNQIGKVNPINKRAMKKPASCADAENTVLKTVGEGKCSGCGACEAICPRGAIKLRNDEEGFLVPVINRNQCINCGICLKKCTSCHPEYKNNADPKCFAMMADDETRAVSSSGGMFSVAAERILEWGGVVCGAAYREDYSVEHIIIEDKKELGRLRGSKYMQSYAGGIFPDIKKYLQEGRTVLFTGMPCQVAGLYSYLGKDYETLYTIDLLCHGITSSKVFEKYHRDVLGGKELSRLEFKEKEPWGWHAGVNAYFTDGTKYSKPLETDPYFIAYLKSIAKNTACGNCVSNRLPRQGDLTIGDFWGIAKYDEELYDKRGTSVVLVNNQKAEAFFEALKPAMKRVKEEPLEAAVKGNRIIQAPYRLHKNRSQFFRHFDELDFTSLTMGCYRNELYKYRKKELLKLLPEHLHEYYYLAQTAAEKARGRKIVLWMRSGEFEKVLKDCFGMDIAFSVAKNLSFVNGKTVRHISEIQRRSGEFYIAALDPKDHGDTYKLLNAYGYSEIEDFICRYPRPIVLEKYDCASGSYTDVWGNTIEGYGGRLGKVVFRGGNNHIIIGDKVTGTENLTFDLSANAAIEIREGNKFTAENRFVTRGYNGKTEILIQKDCRFTDALFRLYNSEHTSSVLIHENCTFESDLELHANSGKKIVIGRDCMFSHDVDLWAGDGHSVFDTATGENVNSIYEKQPPHKNEIVIGEHVWVSKGAFIMHGTVVGTGSIIGAKSVVKGQFPNNCTIGGNPAKLLRTNTAWSRDMMTEDIGTCGREEYYALTEGGDLQDTLSGRRALEEADALPERRALAEADTLPGRRALAEADALPGGRTLTEGAVLPVGTARRRVLILGGTGRMSSELTRLCIANGDDVTISVRGRHKIKDDLASVKKIILDRNDTAATKAILGGQFFDVVFDCSGYLPGTVDAVLSCIKINRYIFVSSFTVYAHYHNGRKLTEEEMPVFQDRCETDIKTGDKSWYARGKYNSEILIAKKYPYINYAIVRIPFVMSTDDDFGDKASSWILQYVSAVMKGEPVCSSRLECLYNFVENKDEARFLYFLSESTFKGVVNFASQGEIAMSDVIRYVENKTGSKAVIEENGRKLPFSGFPETTMDLGKCLSMSYCPMKLEDWIYQKIDKYIAYCRNRERQNFQTRMISGGG